MSRATFTWSETSPAAPGTAASSQSVQSAGSNFAPGVAGPIADYSAVRLHAEIPLNASGGTLDLYAQISPDDGASWYDMIHFTQVAPGAAAAVYSVPLSTATATTSTVKVGKNLAPALASGTVVSGAFSDRMRLVMVAGVSTISGLPIVARLLAQKSERSR